MADFASDRQSVVNVVLVALETGEEIDAVKNSLKIAAINAAFGAMGLELDIENITSNSLGRAVGRVLASSTGIDSVDVFDADELRAALIKQGTKKIIEQLGGSGSGLDALEGLLEREIRKNIAEAARGANSDVLAAANVSNGRIAYFARAARSEQRRLKQDDKSVSNRQRQAKYRASHRKVWV